MGSLHFGHGRTARGDGFAGRFGCNIAVAYLTVAKPVMIHVSSVVPVSLGAMTIPPQITPGVMLPPSTYPAN